jgi:hypothetical protein
MEETLVLLAGVPAAGKTYFGNWLEEHQGFLHLDVEKDGRLVSMGLDGAWNHCFQAGDVKPFVSSLRGIGRPVIVNWGFPPACLPVVQDLKDHGLVLWWFDADRDQARREFTKRGDVSLVAFERQVAAIAANWPAIEAVFQPNIVTTLDAEGRRMEPEEVYTIMFPDR